MSFVNDLSEVAKEYGLELTSDQINAFNRYYELLVEWNEKINLTAITEPREVAIKHIVLMFVKILPNSFQITFL